MGTRHLTIVKKDGKIKIAQYGQWDGYPEGAGKEILSFCRNHLATAEGRESFATQLDKCRFLTENEIDLINELIDKDEMLSRYDPKTYRANWTKRWPELSRDTGNNVLEMVLESENGLGLADQFEFIHDHVFCEWAWMIDLDERIFGNVVGVESANREPYYFAHGWDLNYLPTDEQFLSVYTDEEEE